MSFRNVHYNKKTSEMHIWYTEQGYRRYAIDEWVPYVYVPTNRESSTKSIEGENVIRKKFSKFWKYNNYQKENFCYENNVMPEIQYLAEKYHKISDEDLPVPNLKIFSLDLEIHAEATIDWEKKIKIRKKMKEER